MIPIAHVCGHCLSQAAQASTCGSLGQHLVAFRQCPLSSCSLGLYRTPGKGLFTVESADLQERTSASGGPRNESVCSWVCVPRPVHQVPHSVPQLPPPPSWQPLSSVSLRHSRCLGMPVVTGGFCCPVFFSDCHLTCAPGNIPSGSGLGFWGSGSPPP